MKPKKGYSNKTIYVVVVVVIISGSTEKQTIQQSNTEIKPEKG